jgi:orotate phosphoribosyltransferase-like protein
MLLIKKTYDLHPKGLSKVKISKRLRLSRNTVKKYLRFIGQNGISNEELQ